MHFEDNPLKVFHVNASDVSGGAARAAYRIHKSLVQYGFTQGVHSQLRVIKQLRNEHLTIGGSPAVAPHATKFWGRLRPLLTRYACRDFRTRNSTLHSIAWPSTGLGYELTKRYHQGQADLVNLHWLGDTTLSIEEIGRLPMPLVWTLHDQWAFCGAEHYTSPPCQDEIESSDERFVLGYTRSSRPYHEGGRDLNRITWQRKNRSWCKPIHIVCPSKWLADCVRRSALMSSWPVTVIPNPIDLIQWAPIEQSYARSLLGLPIDFPLILFGADRGTADPRKGADLLLEALQRLRKQVVGTDLEGLRLAVFGQSAPISQNDLGFPVHFLGSFQDDLSLRILYAAADVFVISSRQDNLPNTGLEAHACGTPVVAFRTGGLIDIVDDCVTGALADPFEPQSLANAIQWVLISPERHSQLSIQARRRAEILWDAKHISSSYIDLYHAIGRHEHQV